MISISKEAGISTHTNAHFLPHFESPLDSLEWMVEI